MFFLFSACSCDPMGTLEADGCDMETGSCTCKRYVTGQNCDRCYVSTICLYGPVPENSQLTPLTSSEVTGIVSAYAASLLTKAWMYMKAQNKI